ncbi:hypothetical protein ACHAW6_016194 [Cyclotella cf. meneghiniana]
MNEVAVEAQQDDHYMAKSRRLDEDDSISDEVLDIPKGCVFDCMRPGSPTAVTDFPRCGDNPQSVKLDDTLRLLVSNDWKLPKLTSTPAELEPLVKAVNQVDDNRYVDDSIPPTAILAPTLVADIGGCGHTYLYPQPQLARAGKMADSGANCCMTNNWQLLENIKPLSTPVQVGMALEQEGSTIEMTKCTYIGDLPIECDDGHIIRTKCFYNPYASDTIISPQAILDHSPQFTRWIQVGTKIGHPGVLTFIGATETRTITLHQQNGLYYCNTVKCEIYQAESEYNDVQSDEWRVHHIETTAETQCQPQKRPKRGIPRTTHFQPATKAKILEAETWSLRLGVCHETQLKALPQHAIGIPKQFEFHPFSQNT